METIAQVAEDEGITPPALIVVGKVVDYRDTLRWFDNRPLFGTRILITRPRHQARELRLKLEEKGADVVSMPAIEIQGLEDFGDLDDALDGLSGYDYLVFTSVNGVAAFFKRLFDKGYDVRNLAGLTVAAIGPRTAKELWKYHVRSDMVPKAFVAESLLEEFPDQLQGKRVLIPRALLARDVLPVGLRDRGASVHVVPVYRTVGSEDILDVPEDVDMALFTSSSTVEHFLKRAKLPAGCKLG